MLDGLPVRAGADAAARGGDHDDGGDDRARRAGRGGAERVRLGCGRGAPPPWQRSALMRGAEVALLGAPAPGSPAGRRGGRLRATAPCPTCPGGRAGPGGAYAFPRRRIGPAADAERPDARALASQSPSRRRCRRWPPAAASWRPRGGRAGAHRVARQAGRGGAGRAADAGGTAALQRRAGGLPEHLPGLSSAGWPRSGEARRQARRSPLALARADIPARSCSTARKVRSG